MSQAVQTTAYAELTGSRHSSQQQSNPPTTMTTKLDIESAVKRLQLRTELLNLPWIPNAMWDRNDRDMKGIDFTCEVLDKIYAEARKRPDLAAEVEEFAYHCASDEYMDTGDAWELIKKLYSRIGGDQDLPDPEWLCSDSCRSGSERCSTLSDEHERAAERRQMGIPRNELLRTL